MSFFSKLLSIKGLKRVALWAWESMPEQDRIDMLRHAVHKAGFDWPATVSRTTGSTVYRELPRPEEPPL